MRATRAIVCCALVAALLFQLGCRSRHDPEFGESLVPYKPIATQIEYADADVATSHDLISAPPPQTARFHEGQPEPWPLTLEEAVLTTLANSKVIRDIGGRVLSAPAGVETVYGPALAESDPLTGPEAALSAFDAQFTSSILWGRNDRPINNSYLGGGIFSVEQDTGAFVAEIRKQAATGTTFAMRNLTNYDLNTAPLNLFASVYDTIFEAEVRQPLLQGAGIEFNRIAGPNATPGSYRGVLLARIETDITLADFETAVRDLLYQVDRAYWELYFAYRDLDAKTKARDAALETWRLVQRRLEAGDANREEEARARQQFFFYDIQVANAMSGTTLGIDSASPSGGVLAVERQLRYLMGIPANDGRLIRPVDEPSTVESVLDWRESVQEALWRRVELRKQQWNIKRRELELIAARNFGRARLDFGGKYRWRGFGDDLLGNTNRPLGSAYSTLFTGDYQEWEIGLGLTTPIGNRIGHVAIRNAGLELARERAVYREQELRIVQELSAAFAELDRAYEVSRMSCNLVQAAHQTLVELERKYQVGHGFQPLEFLLEGQNRVAEAEISYHRALTDYTLAITRVFLARGAMLEYYEVHLSEGPWSAEAHRSAAKQARRFAPKLLNYTYVRPEPVSAGVYPQQRLKPRPAVDSESRPLPEVIEPVPAPLPEPTP